MAGAAPARAAARRRLPWVVEFYLTVMRTAVAEQFRYRAANYAYAIGMVAEPVIYLVVWSTVARAQGGAVGGLTPGELAAYYIVWTLVRTMNIVFTPTAGRSASARASSRPCCCGRCTPSTTTSPTSPAGRWWRSCCGCRSRPCCRSPSTPGWR